PDLPPFPTRRSSDLGRACFTFATRSRSPPCRGRAHSYLAYELAGFGERRGCYCRVLCGTRRVAAGCATKSTDQLQARRSIGSGDSPCTRTRAVRKRQFASVPAFLHVDELPATGRAARSQCVSRSAGPQRSGSLTHGIRRAVACSQAP